MTAPSAEPPPSEQPTRRSRGKGNATGPAGPGNGGEQHAAPEPPKLRRRPMLIAVSVLLTAIGALLGAWLLTSLSGTDEYIALRADVQRGDVIEEKDLVSTNLSTDGNVDPLAWNKKQFVVGRYATVDMAKGSLVTSESVATEIRPAEGQTLVGLALVPGQTVTGDLRTGQKVRLVIVPATADSASSTRPQFQAGEVAGWRLSEDGSTKLVDVQVAKDVAPSVAAAASRQEVSLVVDPESSTPGGGDSTPESSPSADSSPSS